MLATCFNNSFAAAVLAAGGTNLVCRRGVGGWWYIRCRGVVRVAADHAGYRGHPNSTSRFPTPKRLNNGRDEGGHLFLNLFFDNLWNLCHFLPEFLKFVAFIRIE
jgi:hypothetical protein